MIATLVIPNCDLQDTPCSHVRKRCSMDCTCCVFCKIIAKWSQITRAISDWIKRCVAVSTLGWTQQTHFEASLIHLLCILLSTGSAPRNTFHKNALTRNGVILFHTMSIQSFLGCRARNWLIHSETLNCSEPVNRHINLSSTCSSTTTNFARRHWSYVSASLHFVSSLKPSRTVYLRSSCYPIPFQSN